MPASHWQIVIGQAGSSATSPPALAGTALSVGKLTSSGAAAAGRGRECSREPSSRPNARVVARSVCARSGAGARRVSPVRCPSARACACAPAAAVARPSTGDPSAIQRREPCVRLPQPPRRLAIARLPGGAAPGAGFGYAVKLRTAQGASSRALALAHAVPLA